MGATTIEQERPVRRVLVSDIAGVLNGSRDKYRMHQFDADKVAQLSRIVRETGCEVIFAPELPTDKTLFERFRYALNALVNLLNAQGLAVWGIDTLPIIGYAIVAIAGRMADKDKECSYCVLRAHDNGQMEWTTTFAGRIVRTTATGGEDSGLTEAVANEVIAMLKRPITADEVPLEIEGLADVGKALRAMGFNPVVLEKKSEKNDFERK